MISYCCGSNSPPQAENFSVFELNIEFPPFENMISQCKCLHTKIPFPQMYVNILFEIRLYVNMFTYHGQILGGSENVKITFKFFTTRVFELWKLSETAAIASVASAHVRTWIYAAGELLTPPEWKVTTKNIGHMKRISKLISYIHWDWHWNQSSRFEWKVDREHA